jgi:putative FmdB family regulatory protein
MPIYEFECEGCGERFEELVASESTAVDCPSCGSRRARKLISQVSPPGRQPRGAKVRSSESRRKETESARQERIADTKRKRARGEFTPSPSRSKGPK